MVILIFDSKTRISILLDLQTERISDKAYYGDAKNPIRFILTLSRIFIPNTICIST